MSIPQELQEFIRGHIDSVETLEILLLLQRSPDTLWVPAAIDSHLGMKPGIADKRLQTLRSGGLVAKGSSDSYRYAPANDGIRASVELLRAAYADRRSTVVNTVFSETLNRLRAFSDAFKVKSE